MKTGRNRPCPCGSGKKYKLCCLSTETAGARAGAPAAPFVRATPAPHPRAWDPLEEEEIFGRRPKPTPDDAFSVLYAQFHEADLAGKIAILERTIPDAELMDGETAFELFSRLLHAIQMGGTEDDHRHFHRLAERLRVERPDVYQAESAYLLSWRLELALAMGEPEAVRQVALEFASVAERNLDEFNMSMQSLYYRGRLDVLLPAMEAAWPRVRKTKDDAAWRRDELGRKLADLVIFDYLEGGGGAPAPRELVKRVRASTPCDRDVLDQYLESAGGRACRAWSPGDFRLTPAGDRNLADEEDEEEPKQDEWRNLYDLSIEFLGWLRRERAVPYARGALAREQIVDYLAHRSRRELQHPTSSPKRPRPGPISCPDRRSLEEQMSGLIGFLTGRYHDAAALLEHLPDWLDFLVERGLLDPEERRRCLESLAPLADEWSQACAGTTDTALWEGAAGWRRRAGLEP